MKVAVVTVNVIGAVQKAKTQITYAETACFPVWNANFQSCELGKQANTK
jgi:hypothetical protein